MRHVKLFAITLTFAAFAYVLSVMFSAVATIAANIAAIGAMR